MTLISTSVVGSGGAASINFTSIPQTGTDLLVVVSIRADSGGIDAAPFVKFNNDATGYSGRTILGNGTSRFSETKTNFTMVQAGSTSTANTFGSGQIYIPNYAGSVNKSFSMETLGENNGTEAWMEMRAGLWSNTAAITSLSIYRADYNILQYSTASLYTILKGSGGASVA
jgi:hypothetical protein